MFSVTVLSQISDVFSDLVVPQKVIVVSSIFLFELFLMYSDVLDPRTLLVSIKLLLLELENHTEANVDSECVWEVRRGRLVATPTQRSTATHITCTNTRGAPLTVIPMCSQGVAWAAMSYAGPRTSPLFGGNGVCGTRSGTEPPSPEGDAWAALECIFALHRPSITFHATPPRTTQHVSTYEHVVRRATLAGYAVRLGSPGIPGDGRRSSPTLVLLYAGDYVGVELGNCSRK